MYLKVNWRKQINKYHEIPSTMDCLIYCTAALIISLSLFYVYAKYKLSYWSRRGVKSPPTHLFFGNFKECILLKKSPSKILREIYDSADPDDPYIGFYICHKPMLLLRDHNLIKQTMITDFDVFSNRRLGSGIERDVVNLDSILSMKQPRWRYVRNKLSPVLTGQKLKNMVPLMMEHGKIMLDFIKKLPTDETGRSKWETKDLTSRYSNDILASLAFGVSTNSFDERENTCWKNGRRIFQGLSNSIALVILFFFPDWDFLIAPCNRKPANYFRKIFWDSMNTREQLAFKRGDMIDSMLALKNGEQNPIYKFDGDKLFAHPSSFYIAGFEASSTTLTFLLYDLARHPEHQDTLYNEMQKHLSGKQLTMDLINELSFLNFVIIESLRLHPPLPVIDRITVRDYKLPGSELIIEKNIPIYVSINGINQDPKYFSNPKNFVPLRTETKGDKKFYESLVFGVGLRSCIGKQLGILIIKVALITILSNYTLFYKTRTSNGNDAIQVLTYAADGLSVQFKKRNEVLTFN